MATPKTILVTGGAGFVGSNFVRACVRERAYRVVNLDKLTYAGSLENVADLETPLHVFVRGDICDRALVGELLTKYEPCAVVNLAAESHVDRSIEAPRDFVTTNVVGTFELLEAARAYVTRLAPEDAARGFRFLQVSTDEVFGSLGATGRFDEASPLRPSSPYSASKAAADHLVSSYFTTYALPTLVTHASNNYGPHQFPEKLIPLMTERALRGEPLPVYGDGQNVRDWLHVSDHCSALLRVLEAGAAGESYNIGGSTERSNLELVHALLDVVERLFPAASNAALSGRDYRSLIRFVTDRPGHDRRYAIDSTKLRTVLGWQPHWTLERGLEDIVRAALEKRHS